MNNLLRKSLNYFKKDISDEDKIALFKKNGCIPWSNGYNEYKIKYIINSINSTAILDMFKNKKLESSFGLHLDERIVEYPWIFSHINKKNNLQVLDAGSTFNFKYILETYFSKSNKLTIATYAPEFINYNNLGISYIYTDLRETPFKDNLFDIIISQSTVEHIDMDNSIYGYDITHNENIEKKSFEYLGAIDEYLRILKNKGQLLITFPFGKFENHGFFQQFDEEMLQKILEILKIQGSYNLSFFKYTTNGWIFTTQEECKELVSYNPHTGKGKLDDGAAHCRSICCIEFIKN